MSLNNQKCMTQPTLINLHPNGYSHELRYYPFAVYLDRCAGSCNALDDLSSRVFIPNETADSNLHVFNMITGINESKTLTKHISRKFERKFGTQIKNGIMISVGVIAKIQRNILCGKNNYIWNPGTCSCENGKYVGSIIDDSMITFDKNKNRSNKNYFSKSRSKKMYCNKFLHFTSLFINYHSIIDSC